ncbi:MAG: CsgG/HfaB family protein [Caulobacter sp.]|nr:CsgG/HfaB family protein [Caulobacter sp.]
MTVSRRLILGAVVALALCHPALAANAPPPPAYDGLKKTIAVDTFLATEAVGGSVTAEGMTAMLTQALANDGRFVVVEGAQAGGITASATVRAAVTKYEANAGGSSLGVGGPMGSLLAGRAGLKSQKAVMEISLRLVDASTGQVISTSKAQGTARSSSADAGVVNNWTGASAGGGTFHTTPIGQAGEDAIAKAVEMIAADMRRVPWSAQVIEADAGRVYVNAGADRNVQAGTVLTVYRQGKVFTDPSTGVVLDVDLQRIGTIRIDSVRDRLSTASVVSGEAPARGDLLKLD